ncbi:MAG TPA: hypothetical protein VJN91_08125 [Gammaproteobacteria bacterium]|nr:hypothetical protein [Gammaproteobacteria bacterium]
MAKEAKDAGLLAADAMENLLREAMRARRIDRLFETMSRLRSQTPALSEEEVQAEIQAARAARRTANADRR